MKNQNNKEGRLYRFSMIVRFITISFALFAFFYALFVIFFKTYRDSNLFIKIVPFVILFLVTNTLIKNLFSVNSIYITDSYIQFNYLLSKNLKIYWDKLVKLEFIVKGGRKILLTYEDNGNIKNVIIPRAFPQLIEILNKIAYYSKHIELDDFMKTVITPINE
ncbi:MAG: hypothetical protein DRH57_02160 [Candidatus Cloacimonadota bacterium]|nr:MAG: hypothetical protein DRH57_02160 [Candidatus Cloacimonadota bacterium]